MSGGNSGFRFNHINSASDSTRQTEAEFDAYRRATRRTQASVWNWATWQSEPLPYHPPDFVPERPQTQPNPDKARHQHKYAVDDNNNDRTAQANAQAQHRARSKSVPASAQERAAARSAQMHRSRSSRQFVSYCISFKDDDEDSKPVNESRRHQINKSLARHSRMSTKKSSASAAPDGSHKNARSSSIGSQKNRNVKKSSASAAPDGSHKKARSSSIGSQKNRNVKKSTSRHVIWAKRTTMPPVPSHVVSARGKSKNRSTGGILRRKTTQIPAPAPLVGLSSGVKAQAVPQMPQLEPGPEKEIASPKPTIEPNPNPSLKINSDPDPTLVSSRHVIQGPIIQSVVLPRRTNLMSKVNTRSYTVVGSEQHLEASQLLLSQQSVGQIGHRRELAVSPSSSCDGCLGSVSSSLVLAYEEKLSAKTAVIVSQAKQLEAQSLIIEELQSNIQKYEKFYKRKTRSRRPLKNPDNARRIQDFKSDPDFDESGCNLPQSESQNQNLPVLRKHSSMIAYLKGPHRERELDKKAQREQGQRDKMAKQEPAPAQLSSKFEYPIQERLQQEFTYHSSFGNSELSSEVPALRTALGARQSLLNELRNRIQTGHIILNKNGPTKTKIQAITNVLELQQLIQTHQKFIRWLNKFTLDGVHDIQKFEKTYLFNHREKVRYYYEGSMMIGDDGDRDGDDNLGREEKVEGIFIPLDLDRCPGHKLPSHAEKSNVLRQDKETMTNDLDTSNTALSTSHLVNNSKVANESGLKTPGKSLVQDELILASKSLRRIHQIMTTPTGFEDLDLDTVVHPTKSRNCALNFFNQQTQSAGEKYYDSSDRSLVTEELYRRPKQLKDSSTMFPIAALQPKNQVVVEPEVQLGIPLVSVESLHKKLDNVRKIVRHFSNESLDIVRNSVVKRSLTTIIESGDSASSSSLEGEYESCEAFPGVGKREPDPALESCPEEDEDDASSTLSDIQDSDLLSEFRANEEQQSSLEMEALKQTAVFPIKCSNFDKFSAESVLRNEDFNQSSSTTPISEAGAETKSDQSISEKNDIVISPLTPCTSRTNASKGAQKPTEITPEVVFPIPSRTSSPRNLNADENTPNKSTPIKPKAPTQLYKNYKKSFVQVLRTSTTSFIMDQEDGFGPAGAVLNNLEPVKSPDLGRDENNNKMLQSEVDDLLNQLGKKDGSAPLEPEPGFETAAAEVSPGRRKRSRIPKPKICPPKPKIDALPPPCYIENSGPKRSLIPRPRSISPAPKSGGQKPEPTPGGSARTHRDVSPKIPPRVPVPVQARTRSKDHKPQIGIANTSPRFCNNPIIPKFIGKPNQNVPKSTSAPRKVDSPTNYTSEYSSAYGAKKSPK